MFEAVKILKAANPQKYLPQNDASYPSSQFGLRLKQIAQLIKADVGLEVAFADIGGWDTHVNEVGAPPGPGQPADKLTDFWQLLAAFYYALGDMMADVTVGTMSEFGRAPTENGHRGPGHGH